MSQLMIEEKLINWMYDLKCFVRFVLLETNIEYIDECIYSLMEKHPHIALTNHIEASTLIGWIEEFHCFKCAFALFPDTLENFRIAAVYVHCKDDACARHIIENNLYENEGYSTNSGILKTTIVIDQKFIENIDEFYDIWHNKRHS